MPRQTKLRAVAEGDQKPPRKPALSVSKAAEEGTRRDLLVALRTRIAASVEDPNTPPRDLAALSRRLLEVAREIEALDVKAAEEAAESGGPTPDAEWEAI